MPHSDETFYKMAVGWTDDPKVVALGRYGATNAILARDLFSQMIGYSRRNLTDGLVPAQEVGRLMYPLPVELAEELAGYLADPGPFGALCGAHTHSTANGNAGSTADSNADSNAGSNAASIVSWVVLNYPKWNDTAADVLGRKAQGRQAAKTRWSRSDADSSGWSPSSILDRDAGSNAGRTADGIQRARGRVHTEQEQEQETPLPPARNDAHRTGRATTARRGGTRTPPPAQEVLGRTHRAGGPTADVEGWAAKARQGITKPEDTPPENDPEPAHQDPDHPATAEEPAEDEIPF
jgi:hypothetical protein